MERIILKEHTTMNMGGETNLIRLSSPFEADTIWQRVKGKEYFILSGGSNLLVSDDLIYLACIKIEIDGMEFKQVDTSVTASVGAGVDFDYFVEQVSSRGLTGLEVLAGIPGLVGACPVQNIGAYGAEASEFIQSVSVYDTQTEEYCTLDSSQCGFGYRSSIFNSISKGRYWILGVNFIFSVKDSVEAGHRDIVTELGSETARSSEHLRNSILSIRRRKGMLAGEDFPKSAGSFFKNPVISRDHYETLKERFPEMPSFDADSGVKIPAAWMIGAAGFSKGTIHKGVGISPYHNLSLINRGQGNFSELMELADNIIEAVDSNFQVRLQIEPEIIR
ncbi:MAG: UDP-N-acetylmuramate dehydrogenase [Bacteriovoracaceae bacterium]|nr:UDP-N-acetylmuramate dehydrogenase [Bacteriovoracaceae bacterium]